jgi:pyruvate dehydrogenase E1 component beta subunit
MVSFLVARAPICGGIGLGAQHSKSLELVWQNPGIRGDCAFLALLMPRLLKRRADMSPVLFLEHRLLYSQTGLVPEENFSVPRSADKRAGTHLT